MADAARKLHILMVTHYFAPDSGAAAVRLTRLAKLLVARGHTVTVLATMPHYPQGRIKDGYRGKFTLTEDIDGVRVVRAWLWATPSKRISRRLLSQLSFMVTATVRGLAMQRPDVVFIEAQPVFTGFAGTFISRLKRVRYVCNVSDFWPEHLVSVGAVTERNLIYRVAMALINRMYRHAHGLIGVNPALTDSLIRRVGQRDDIHTIFNAVDLDRFTPNHDPAPFKAFHDLPTDKQIVSFVGTFGTHINIDLMLDVAKRLRDRDDTIFLYIGTGGQSEMLEQRVQQDGLHNVRWIGWVDHTEMPLAWVTADITHWAIHNRDLYRGALQAKIYEALASGVPLVVSTEGLTAEVTEASGGGVAVAFDDGDGMTREITRLLDDPTLRRQLSAAGRAYAEANFEPEQVVAAYEAVLLDAAPATQKEAQS